MPLQPRTLRPDRGGRDVAHELHGVRIPHRDDGDLGDVQRFPPGVDGLPHIHAHLTVGLELRADDTPQRLYRDLALLAEAVLVHEFHEAARAVAALLDLAAVAVE